MAEGIDSQLKRMSQDLKDIIDHLNTTNASSQDSKNPVCFLFVCLLLEKVSVSALLVDPPDC